MTVLNSCSDEEKVTYSKETQLRKFLNSKEIEAKNTVIVVLFNSYCNPCLDETKKFVLNLPHSEKLLTKDKILICNDCEFFGIENIAEYKIVDENRETLESIGLYSPDNYIIEFDSKNKIIAFSNLLTDNFPQLKHDYNIAY